MMSRYLELVATVQLFKSERKMYFSERDAFYWAGKSASSIPMCHAVILLAAAEAIANLIHVPFTKILFVRGIILAPFFVVVLFLNFDTEYLQNLRMKMQAAPPEFVAKKRKEAKSFEIKAYLFGLASLCYLIFLQAYPTAI